MEHARSRIAGLALPLSGFVLIGGLCFSYARGLSQSENERLSGTRYLDGAVPDGRARVPTRAETKPASFDPLAVALASVGRTQNREAAVPPQCYTKTEGVSNPCWTCHTPSRGLNAMADSDLQEEYAFSDFALKNRWKNLFTDVSADVAKIADAEILGFIREDNYRPLREALRARDKYAGYVPDLDFERGFDEHGFARDGSGWRAIRFKPFPGSFWPTNGSTDDVFVRLPRAFRERVGGAGSQAIYRTNLAILEAAVLADPLAPRDDLVRGVEPIDETASGIDLDHDARLGTASVVRGLPSHYAGEASDRLVRAGSYPQGTEFLHSVRYVDPDAPALLSRRMKELRYSRKVMELDRWATVRAYEREMNEKEEGVIPVYPGGPEVGYRNAFGWQLQGFIEDEAGRLRAQTEEEHRYCMGCHSTIGVTIDQTFAFPRKVPGREGYRLQDLRGMQDVPQAGHADPEILTYFRRVGGGDEFRQNREVLARFFRDGKLDEAEVRRAAPGGDRDITHLIAPSRERALAVNKVYRVIVARQSFALGRDALLGTAVNVHASIENGSTDLAPAGKIYNDGRLELAWPGSPRAKPVAKTASR